MLKSLRICLRRWGLSLRRTLASLRRAWSVRSGYRWFILKVRWVRVLFFFLFPLCSSLLFGISAGVYAATVTPYPCPTPMVPIAGGCVMPTGTVRATSTAYVVGTQPAPTASGTYGAIMQTATALASQDSIADCPAGNPYGWGVLTPDPLWYYQCSHCIQTGSQSTTTPYPCPTPYEMGGNGGCYLPDGAWETATAAATSTAGPTATGGVPGSSVWNDANGWDGWEPADTDYAVYSGGVWTSVFQPGGSRYTIIASPDFGEYIFLDSMSITYTVSSTYTTGQARVWKDLVGGDPIWDGDLIQILSLSKAGGQHTQVDETDYTLRRIVIDFQALAGYTISVSQVVFNYQDAGPGTPVPTATAPPWGGGGDFVPGPCDIVQPAPDGSYPGGSDMWNIAPGFFEAPDFSVGDPVCQEWAEFTVTVNEYGFTDITWPGLTLCIVPVTVGTLTIMGISLNLDLLLGSMVAMGLLKWFWR